MALIGAGCIGSFHAESIARRIYNANRVAVADPMPGAAQKLADKLDCERVVTEISEL